jgi:RNA polymerase sigma factor (sigma-70 family)
MASHQAGVIKSLRQIFHQGPATGLDDGQLLERFVSRRDEAAFTALVALHGPMVLGVCRRILRHEHDIEDAFQATFLVLVRRAGSIRDAGRLGPWLHGVARRVALRARAEANRRRVDVCQARRAGEDLAMGTSSEIERTDLLGIIDEEVARLPAAFREAVVLCDLEGRSYSDAARRLRCPLGTLQSRLARGRARLRSRLTRRGLAPEALGAALLGGAAAAVPESLAAATLKAATAMISGQAAAAASATALALAASVTKGLTMSLLQKVAIASTVVSVLIGAGLAAGGARPDTPVAPSPIEFDPQKPTEPPKTGRVLKLDVIRAADRSPVAGATVWTQVSNKAQIARDLTDDEGRVSIALPASPNDFIQVAVAHPGFVPTELRWKGDEVPDAYTQALEPGVPIGGTVVDEQGQPIAGARVFPSARGTNAPWDWPELFKRHGDDIAARTDADGRWRSDALPVSAGPDVRLWILVLHPDHIPTESSITAREARDRTGAQVLKTGRSVSGSVFSPTGKPVSGAIVIVSHRSGNGRFAKVATDAVGRFRTGRLIDPQWENLTLTVQADGFASAIRRLTNTPEILDQVIRLTPRRPLHGCVIDSQGRPVAGAAVSYTRLFVRGELDWEAETDAAGRFVWFEAPTSGTIDLDVRKPAFRQIVGRRIDAGTREITLTLHRAQRLHGTVTDAETGKPLERFKFLHGWSPNQAGWTPRWARDKARTFTNGRFDLTGELTDDQDTLGSIRIEADGYEPAELIGFPDNAEDVAHDFRLRRSTRKATPLTGIIRGPDGRPIEGADVAVCPAGGDVRLENGNLSIETDETGAARTRTGRDGRYTFVPRNGRASLVVAHGTGFALRSAEELANSTDVTLAPWGRIEGVMKIGTRPAGKQKVSAWLLDRGPMGRVDYDRITDDDGRFVLDRVIPGRLTVYRYVDDADHRGWTDSNPVDVEVKPCETVRVQVGGMGRPVVGRLGLPRGITLANFNLNHGGFLTTGDTWPPYPPDYPDWSDEQRSSWWDAFRKTPESRAYIENPERHYAITIRPDGRFQIDDVPAGRYILKLPFTGNSGGDRANLRAFVRVHMVVPEIPGGRSDEPLNLGTIPLEVFPFQERNVGDRVPDLPWKATDGRPLNLASLRGKYVLLAFWATYHRQTLASIHHLQAVHGAFGRDPRLVIIGLNEDVNPDVMHRYVAHRHLAWEQRYLGSGDDPNPIASAFGTRYPNRVFLIGPDGRILAKDLQGEEIPQAVAAALSKK